MQQDKGWKGTTELFVYGDLKPNGKYPPQTMRGWVEDAVYGRLIEYGNNLSVVPDERTFVNGYTIVIDEKELPALDLYEGPEYTRIQVTTVLGFVVWMYQAKGVTY